MWLGQGSRARPPPKCEAWRWQAQHPDGFEDFSVQCYCPIDFRECHFSHLFLLSFSWETLLCLGWSLELLFCLTNIKQVSIRLTWAFEEPMGGWNSGTPALFYSQRENFWEKEANPYLELTALAGDLGRSAVGRSGISSIIPAIQCFPLEPGGRELGIGLQSEWRRGVFFTFLPAQALSLLLNWKWPQWLPRCMWNFSAWWEIPIYLGRLL